MKRYTLPPEIARLTGPQRAQLDAWLDDTGYYEVMARFEKEFGAKITYNKIQRYSAQRGLASQLSTYCDTAMTTEDLLLLFNGQPGRFTEAGLVLVRKRAFELAAERNTSVSKLNGLHRIFTYQHRLSFEERRMQVAEKNADTRERAVAVRERMAVVREDESRERCNLMSAKRAALKEKNEPKKPAQPPGESDCDRAAKVIQHCGGVEGFVGQFLPGERLTVALRRLHDEIQKGTFRPLAPGEPPRFEVPEPGEQPAPGEATPQSSSDSASQPAANNEQDHPCP